MSLKIAVIKEYEDIPVGSVIQDCKSKIINGKEYWAGLWCSMHGSFNVWIPKDNGEVWNEEKHDPTGFFIKKHFAEKKAIREEAEERATLARLKLKYEKDTNG